MKRRLRALAITLVFVSPNVSSQELASIATNTTVNDILNRLVGYASVAYACGNKLHEARLKSKLDQLLNLARQKRSLTTLGLQMYEKSDVYVIAGAAIYQRQPYVTCAEAKGYTDQLIDATDQLIRANSR